MNCCDHENRLTLFLLGDLSERDEAEFSRHLADCARCQENARMLSPVLKALETGLARDHVRTPRFDLHHQLTLLSVPAESTHRLVDWMVRARPWLVAAASGMVVTGLIYAVVFSSMLQQYGWNRRPTPTPGGWARVDCEAFSGVYLNGGRVLQPVFSEWTESATNAAHADRWGVVLALDFTEMPAAGTEQIPETPLDLPSDRECGPRYAQLEDKAKMVESAAAHFKGVTRYASRTMEGRARALQAYGDEDTGPAYVAAVPSKLPPHVSTPPGGDRKALALGKPAVRVTWVQPHENVGFWSNRTDTIWVESLLIELGFARTNALRPAREPISAKSL